MLMQRGISFKEIPCHGWTIFPWGALLGLSEPDWLPELI
jgi:hypothetical protein